MDIMIIFISFCIIAFVALVLIPVDQIIHVRKQHKIYKEIDVAQHTDITYTGQFEKRLFQLAEKSFYFFRAKINADRREKIDAAIIATGLDRKMNVETYVGLKFVSAMIVFVMYFWIGRAHV